LGSFRSFWARLMRLYQFLQRKRGPMTITRRSFAAGLTIAAIGTKLRSDIVLPAAANTASLDIGFHGLWAFFVGTKSILAATPWNSEHCYLARELPGVPVVLPAGQLYFTGLTAGAGTFPSSNQLTEHYKQGIDLQSWFVTLLLPMPASVQARRVAKLKFLEETTARSGYLSYHLKYDVDPNNPPTIKGLPQWKPNWQAESANIDFHAEPDHMASGPHASAALNDLCAKLGLNYHVDRVVSYPPSTPPPADEDKSLYELHIPCAGAMKAGIVTVSQKGVLRLVDGAVVDCLPFVIAGAPVPGVPQ
jgi:hypothetical protein